MKFNKGQLTIGIGITFGTIMLAGVGTFYGVATNLYSKIRDNQENIGGIETVHGKDLEQINSRFDEVNGKLDKLLDNFNVSYEPK